MLRIARIRHYVSEPQAFGISACAVLANTGMAQADLVKPGCKVVIERYHVVVANGLRLTGNNGIGFDIGALADATLGPLMQAVPT